MNRHSNIQMLFSVLILIGLMGCGRELTLSGSNNSQGPVRFIGYGLQSEPQLTGDGWKGYRVGLAFENTTRSPLSHTLISFEGSPYVETEGGEIYDAQIVKIRDNRILTSGLPAVDFTKPDYRQTVPLPPHVLVTKEVYSSMGWLEDSWAAVFQVPETLIPAQLVIPGFETISLDGLPTQIGTQDLRAQKDYGALPAERTSQGDMIGIVIDQPRLVVDENQTALAVNLNITNKDLTGNKQVDYSFSLVDSRGELAPGYRMFCDGSERDFALEDVLPSIGPGQVREGILCFTLGENNPSSYQGDYVLSVRINDLLESFLLDDVSLAD